MATRKDDQRLGKIADTLGVRRDDLLEKGPAAEPPQEAVVIDGAPDQFETWADGVVDPGRRKRLTKIAGILKESKTKRGTP